jgi:hypothetical protein
MYYTATISRNLRQLSPGQCTVLLRNIQHNDEEFRDHTFTELTPELEQVLRAKCFNSNRSMKISFKAKVKEYNYRGEVFKRTLCRLKDIQIIGKA